MIGIYKILSPSGRVYIGQSNNIEKRFKDYKNLNNCKNQHKLYRSFLKYGVLSHTFEFIHECGIDELNDLERYYQDLYNVIETGLNCLLTSTKERKLVFSKETLKRKSDAVKGSKHPNWGKKSSAETCRKISENQKGKFISESTRKKISEAQKGRPMPDGCTRSGFDNHKSIKVLSKNIITGDELIMNLSDTAKFFKVDRELISNRINGISKNYRKHKDWMFYDNSK